MAAEREVRTRLTVVDESGGVVENFERRVSRAVDRVSGSVDVSSETFRKSARMLSSAMVVWDRYEIATIAVENAQIRQQLAQDQLTYSVQKYGAGSREAWRAQQQLEISTRGVEIAQQRMHVRMLFGTLVVLPDLIRGMTSLFGWLNKITGATIAQTLATQGLTRARLAALAVTGVGIPLAIGGLLLAQGIERGGVQPQTDINVYGDMNVNANTPAELARQVSNSPQLARSGRR